MISFHVASAKNLEIQLQKEYKAIYNKVMNQQISIFKIRENQHIIEIGFDIDNTIASLLNSIVLLYRKKIIIVCEHSYHIPNSNQLIVIRV